MGAIKQIIIVGGGSSINGIPKDELNSRLKNRLVIACNVQYRFRPHTFSCWIDKQGLYEQELKHWYQEFTSERLWVCRWLDECFTGYQTNLSYNNIPPYPANHHPLKIINEFDPTLKKGVYASNCGMFALTLASYLLDGEGEIFLLGFDNRIDPDQMAYHCLDERDINYNYRGLDFCRKNRLPKQYYDENHPKHYQPYQPYLTLEELKIYNVNPNSWIKPFEKIDYRSFFESLNPTVFSDQQLQVYVKNRLAKIG